MGTGVFGTDDCRATYEELQRGASNSCEEPAERSYGVEATSATFGNWFSLTQRT